jgi:lysyl-tRNA synthetase class 2
MALSASPAPSPWWSPHVHADRRPRLLVRAKIAAAFRAFFAARDFVEVDTAALQASPGNEAHIGAFGATMADPSGSRAVFLHTSPEFACKKLLAAGEKRLFSLGHVFRNGERGPLHHPEFTMLEWYRAGEGLEALVADCAELLRIAAGLAGTAELRFRDRSTDPFGPIERISVADAFGRFAGIDLMSAYEGDRPDRDRLAQAATTAGVRVTADDTWSDIFSKVLSEKVEPSLGLGRATILDQYPACEAALARRSAADPRLAERFELYACGVELANAFGELTDPAEQRQRFEEEMDERQRIYGERFPIDEDFLAALAIMPDASGIALGFDRLVMLATGASRIEDVLWTPVTETGV